MALQDPDEDDEAIVGAGARGGTVRGAGVDPEVGALGSGWV